MKWKYEDSDQQIKVDEKFVRFSGKLGTKSHVIIPAYVVRELERKFGISLIKNCEMVFEIKGIMLPPNKWVKITKE